MHQRKDTVNLMPKIAKQWKLRSNDHLTFKFDKFNLPLSSKNIDEIKDHLVQENKTITLARDFLRKQKQSIRQRQSVLQAARKELDDDVLTYQIRGESGANILEDVRNSLDQEANEISKLKLNMTTGARLLKEKEVKLRQLENMANNVVSFRRNLKIIRG